MTCGLVALSSFGYYFFVVEVWKINLWRFIHIYIEWFLTCVVYNGTGLFGMFTDFIPFAKSLHMHRFIGGVQIFAICLLAVAIDGYLGQKIKCILFQCGRHKTSTKIQQGVLILFIVWLIASFCQSLQVRWKLIHGGRVKSLTWNAMWTRQTQEAPLSDFEILLTFLKKQPPGRIFAGFLEHKWYNWINAVLQENGFVLICNCLSDLYYLLAFL